MRKYRVHAILFLLTTSVWGVRGGVGWAQSAAGIDLIEELKLYSRALGAIMEGYAGDVEARQLFYEAVRGMTKSLDKHSEFIDPEKYELMKISIAGEYAGIGTWLKEADGKILIENIRPGTSAEKAGLRPGDIVLAVDGLSLAGKTVAEAGALLRGDAGTEVLVRLFRDQEFEVTLVRETIELESIRDVRKVGRAIGYMQIMDFQEKTVAQMDAGLADLEKQGIEALIIDLRNDGGGLMTQAVAMAERFLPAGAKIVSVNSKIDVQRKEHIASGSVRVYDYPMVILVNQFSASASEIFSAAMQDHKRATLVGVKTFGKASVQSVVPLDERSAMKLTTARYLSPNGRQIDGIGLDPDVVVEDGTSDNPQAQNQIKAAIAILKDYF